MKCHFTLIVTALVMVLSACEASPVCPPNSTTYLPAQHSTPIMPTQNTSSTTVVPELVQMGNSTLKVDQVVHGYLCNNSLRGTVYIACDIRVNQWEDKPLFLDRCDFSVAPGTVIYVAAHQNAAYYNGCASCHASNKAP